MTLAETGTIKDERLGYHKENSKVGKDQYAVI